MGIEKVNSPEETRAKLTEALKRFVDANEQFNVQGEWTGEDGVTVSVLSDFGIEDYENSEEGDYYVVSVSAKYGDNRNLLYEDYEEYESLNKEEIREKKEKLKETLKESRTLREAAMAMEGAIKRVFKVSYRELQSQPVASDVDVSITIPVVYGDWETK